MIALSSFILGIGAFISGVLILVRRVTGTHIKALADQTTQLAQKGLADELAGLVGNATNLLDAVNQLVRTTAGIGVFLALIGLLVVVFSCWLAVQLYPVWP
jgi:hypothetical protein